MLGQVRSVTGGSRLLMRQKLKQFVGLVDMAEEQSGPAKTTAEDLQVRKNISTFSIDSQN